MDITEISLTDCKIKAITKANNNMISILSESAYLINEKKFSREVEIIIKDWEAFQIKLFVSTKPFETPKEQILGQSDFEEFEVIQEIEKQDSSLLLKGFSKTSGAWMEYSFKSSTQIINFNLLD
jgi:biotin synthase-related radical SAM superfamily protein